MGRGWFLWRGFPCARTYQHHSHRAPQPKPPGHLKEQNGSAHAPAVEAEMPLGLENPTCGAMGTREVRREASVATTSGNSPHGPDPHRGASTPWVAPPMNPGYLLPWAADCGSRVPSFLHTLPTQPRGWNFCSHAPSALATSLRPTQHPAASNLGAPSKRAEGHSRQRSGLARSGWCLRRPR